MAEDYHFEEGALYEEEEEDEEEDDIGGLARAKVIIDKRISTSTRKGYDCHIKKLVKWLKIHHLDQVVTINGVERPRIPLPHAVLMQFLGDAPRLDRNGRLKAADKNPIANSTMNGIASAINDLYREAKIEMEQATRIEVSSAEQTKLSKGRMMIAQVIAYAVQLGALQNENVNITSLGVLRAGNIFFVGFNHLVQQLEQKNQTKLGVTRRYGEMAYTTVYKLFKEE